MIGRETILERIRRRIDVDPETDCWLWRGALSQGYAQLGAGGKVVYGHRALWAELHGPLGPSEVVCHRCDVRRCCNSEHLFKGSHADNARDRNAKGRQARGERVPQAKLTADLVRAIRADPRSQRPIAADYGINQTQVSHIKRRMDWAHVPMEDNP